jgi:hypothetical protein
MKIATKIIAVASAAVVLSGSFAFAGEGKTFKEKVVVEQPTKWYSAALSTGYDSLYMFRGVNTLSHGVFGDTGDYGSGIYWTDLNFTWNITENDFLTVGSWMAFGTSNTAYKELDLYTTYTHNFGNLAASAGYIFYYVFGASPNLFANELNVKLAYTFDLGFMSVVPSIAYYFNLGPDVSSGHGLVSQASSYLLLRVDGTIPVYKDVVALAPWIGYGTNFEYNARLESDGEYNWFNGANNIEVGLGLPVKLNSVISVYGYVAYSYAFYNLNATTDPSTVWGGAKVTFAF